MADSIAALVAYWGKLNAAYGSDVIKAKPALLLNETKLDGLDRVKNLEELVVRVNQAIGASS